ncbi:MAG: hypothetical protein HOD60_08975 [Candidatus Nitrosopelagicus sp.]|jgi:hypothetical protein|nr:hypothetical protein [Candidatus Nitrosopelagicus sp.]
MSSQIIGNFGDKTIIRKDNQLAEVDATGSIKIIDEPKGILFLDYMPGDQS